VLHCRKPPALSANLRRKILLSCRQRGWADFQLKESVMLHLIWSVIVGFLVGLLARWFYPGAVHLGFWMTVALGIGGSLLGGLIGSLIKRPAGGQIFHPAGFIMSIIGSVIILVVAHHTGHL
jgi:uncharacterized membrane protein YeaQ/YmgE (transglycosylase-associated protein family)